MLLILPNVHLLDLADSDRFFYETIELSAVYFLEFLEKTNRFINLIKVLENIISGNLP